MDESSLSRPPSDPVDLVYQACYAPVDLESLLATAETRSKIRRLPASQVYFGLSRLEPSDLERLLPQLTEEQWQGILDLDIWDRDRADPLALAGWQRYVLTAEDPVARKLARALDPDLWLLLWKERLTIHELAEEAVEQPINGELGDWLDTPDGFFRICLPDNPEEAKLLRDLILRLYDLNAEETALSLQESQWRTQQELQEATYQLRLQRLQDLGFQDYFEAIEIYSPVSPGMSLLEKRVAPLKSVELLPVHLRQQSDRSTLLVLRAILALDNPAQIQELLEELFFVCNKVLSADRISAAAGEEVRKGIRKAITGMNLGLDLWAEGSLAKAMEGVQRHYLRSFFQIGLGSLCGLRERAEGLLRAGMAEPGSFEEQLLEGLGSPYPLMVEIVEGKLRRGFIEDRNGLEKMRQALDGLEEH